MLEPGMYLVNRYEILEKIGSGGMADVYKAKCHVLNRLVAIKVLKQEYSSDATFVKKFRVEAQSAAGLSHPNIVSVYDVGEDNGTYFIVMELVQGITLKNYIDMKGKLDIREALNISVQIASGLSAAHDNRIIHRDIKPQNIIMSRDGKVKVTDFGIAKVADSTTVTTTAAGTVHYISPEQARGGYSDEKSDIYSLGITMYEMLTGRVPFEGETNVAVALLHIQAEMTPPRELEPSIPVSFEKIILKCTQKKPDRRYASARELIADLRKVLTHPDGDYVVIPGALVEGKTIVMNEDDVNEVKNRAHVNPRTSGATPKKQQVRKPEPEPELNQDDDDEDEDVNPALTKVMMGLGIGGFVILLIIILVVAANAIGLFGGGGLFAHKTTESETETATELISTESSSESDTSDTFDMPSLIGMTEENARTTLTNNGLGIKVVRNASDTVPEGEVYDQSPAANTKVAKHTQITVYISTGKASFTLDDVSGMDYSQAQAKLENKGLKVSLEFEYDDTDKDKVIRTSPKAGSSVSEGDTVTIYASQGPETEMVEVPDVRKYSLDSAISKLKNAGLTYGSYSEDYSDSYDEGEVMAQSVSPYSSVEEGTTVNLTVSLGKKVVNYTASVNIGSHSPFGTDITDEEGNTDVFDKGHVTVTLTQDGTTTTIYDEDTTMDSMPSSLSATSTSSSSCTATLYFNGDEFDSWSVSFN